MGKTGFALLNVILAGALLAGATSRADDFDYLDSGNNSVTTTHQIRYLISIDDTFDSLGELHHRESNGERVFNVSLAAYANADEIVMVHAEVLEDGSGILDYRNLPQAILNDISFGFREQCLPAEIRSELENNPEAQFVTEKGFSIDLPFILADFLLASDDGNAEIAISYGRSLDSCDDMTDSLRTRVRERVDAILTVRQVP